MRRRNTHWINWSQIKDQRGGGGQTRQGQPSNAARAGESLRQKLPTTFLLIVPVDGDGSGGYGKMIACSE